VDLQLVCDVPDGLGRSLSCPGAVTFHLNQRASGCKFHTQLCQFLVVTLGKPLPLSHFSFRKLEL
jgi:hypothetical protein